MFMALSVAACSGHAEHLQSAPIEILVTSDADTLDPRYVTDAVGFRISRLVHAGLTTLDPDSGAPLPYLAKSIETSTDGLTVTFELRDDVRFHSGAPFTSHDVAKTIAAFKDARVASRHARVLDAIGSVEEKGEHTVTVHLSRAHATTLTDLEIPILRADQAFLPADPNGALDGLGPFTVARRTRGTIELSPAEQSVLPKPIHSVRIRAVRDENARALRLLAGDSDGVVSGISPPLLPSLEEQGLHVTSRPSLSVSYVVLRVDRGAFASEPARVALGLAIDRESIVRYLLAGHARVATGMLAPSHWAYAGADQARSFEPGRARATLAGQPVHATLLCGTDRLRLDIARAMAQQAADAGIDLEVVPLELGALLARLGAGDFDAATLQLPDLVEPNTLRFFLHSSLVPPQGSNRGHVNDEAVDALLEEGDRVQDRSLRRAVYASLEARIAERGWILPLWHEDQIVALGPRASGFSPSADGRWLALAALGGLR